VLPGFGSLIETLLGMQAHFLCSLWSISMGFSNSEVVETKACSTLVRCESRLASVGFFCWSSIKSIRTIQWKFFGPVVHSIASHSECAWCCVGFWVNTWRKMWQEDKYFHGRFTYGDEWGAKFFIWKVLQEKDYKLLSWQKFKKLIQSNRLWKCWLDLESWKAWVLKALSLDEHDHRTWGGMLLSVSHLHSLQVLGPWD